MIDFKFGIITFCNINNHSLKLNKKIIKQGLLPFIGFFYKFCRLIRLGQTGTHLMIQSGLSQKRTTLSDLSLVYFSTNVKRFTDRLLRSTVLTTCTETQAHTEQFTNIYSFMWIFDYKVF